MTFKLPTPTFITPNTVKILYDLKMKIYSLHLRGLTGIIFFAILAILILTLIAIIYDDANDNESQQTTRKSSIKLLEKMIFRVTLRNWLQTIIGVGVTFLLGTTIMIGIYLEDNPYAFVDNEITLGTAVIDKDFGSQSNTNDLNVDDNKLFLSDSDDTFLLATASRTQHTLTLKPASKTGKAYLRVLEYARKHKNSMFKPNLTVALDKTTLTYKSIDGNQTIVCYANNTNKTVNNTTVLHY